MGESFFHLEDGRWQSIPKSQASSSLPHHNDQRNAEPAGRNTWIKQNQRHQLHIVQLSWLQIGWKEGVQTFLGHSTGQAHILSEFTVMENTREIETQIQHV